MLDGFDSLFCLTTGCGNLIAAFIMYWMFGIAGQRLAYRIRLQLYRAMLFSEVRFILHPRYFITSLYHSIITAAGAQNPSGLFLRLTNYGVMLLLVQPPSFDPHSHASASTASQPPSFDP
jgi:hypothetical protein